MIRKGALLTFIKNKCQYSVKMWIVFIILQYAVLSQGTQRELTCKSVLLEFPQNFTDKWAYIKKQWQVPLEDAKVCSAEFDNVDNDFFCTVYT